MFTVVIAENKYIDKIKEYELFLKPFLSSGEVVFCQWELDKERLADMVPALAENVGRRKEWRAVIVCNDAGIEKQNPFDMVTYLPRRFDGPIRGSRERIMEAENAEEARSEYEKLDEATVYALEHDLDNVYSDEYKQFLQEEHENKLKAYDEAAGNPLTRLVTFFCNTPTVTKEEDSAAITGDPDYARYIVENRRKQELRGKILGDELMEISQPTEVLCIAKRTYVSAEREFDNVWSTHTEMEYSRFYDRNMYFDRMRYLVFDILPENQRDYTFDYIRFLYATILLASNPIPNGCLSAERIYKLECENDEQALCKLLQTYEAKLDATKDVLNNNIQRIREKKPHKLTDYEARNIFLTEESQPVNLDGVFLQEELMVSHKGIGLADGCPTDEAIFWDGEYKRSQKGLAKMLKQSRRSLRRAVVSMRSKQDITLNGTERLSEFQMEDLQEFVDNQELAMLNTDTLDLYDEEALYRQMGEGDAQVQEKIQQRMYKRTTFVVGILSCVAFVLGFFTLFFKNASLNAFNFTTSLIMTAISLGAFALVALVVLLCLRWSLVARFKKFNNLMHDVGGRVYNSLTQYSKYLSHLCNVRRGYAALNAIRKNEDPDVHKIAVYKKHIADIEMARAEARDIFGQFMIGKTYAQTELLSAYDYNFDVPGEYVYPVPHIEGTARKITFIQTGVYAEVPVEFVKSIMVRREELYE